MVANILWGKMVKNGGKKWWEKNGGEKWWKKNGGKKWWEKMVGKNGGTNGGKKWWEKMVGKMVGKIGGKKWWKKMVGNISPFFSPYINTNGAPWGHCEKTGPVKINYFIF